MSWTEKFFERCQKVDLWQSAREEHNRYIKAPKGVITFKWFQQLMRLKYEYISGEASKTKED